jgi:glycyl-tRNA synthetase
MENIFNINGLIFWSEKEIKLRNSMAEYFKDRLYEALLETNPAWKMLQIEAPLLTPRNLLNSNYTNEDIWVQAGDTLDHSVMVHQGFKELALRPETTPGSYAYTSHLLNTHSGTKPPFVIWQSGKSFRREQDQVSKNMRLKEFYQQEFQCIYAADTLNDYHTVIQEPVRKMLSDQIGLPTRLVESDRLPSYSQITTDVEVDNGDKWMEVCSISRRTDFPEKFRMNSKGKLIEKDLLVLEVAIGLDRCIYNFLERTK